MPGILQIGPLDARGIADLFTEAARQIETGCEQGSDTIEMRLEGDCAAGPPPAAQRGPARFQGAI